MKKTVYGFPYVMKKVRLLLLFQYLAVATVLNITSVQSDELADVQSWADFQAVNLVSVSAVAEDCKKIFDVCRADTQKVIDNLTLVVQKTDDSTAGPPKVWDALTQITNVLKNGSKQVRFHFSEIADHFLKRLDGAIRIGKFKHSEKIRELQNIYNADIDTSNELVISLNKYFSNNYNPNSNLQETVIESLNQNTYSQSTAETELQQLSTIVKGEIDTLEKSAIELLNQIYKGVTIAKEVLSSLRNTGAYPDKWDERYIKDNLQNCSFFSKAIASGNDENSANTNDTTAPDANTSSANTSDTNANDDNDLDDLTDVSLDATNDDNTGCAEIFRRTEKKIAKQLVLAIKELKSMKDAKEIDSRTFKIFKNYSFILSNLNQKVITAIITFVNQFFQLYHIVLSILDKINPDMKAKAVDILYMTDVDTSDSHYENINKFIVEDYLSSAKMRELYQRINDHVKTMKSLAEIQRAITQEISVTTNGIGQDMQTMKNTILYIFEEIQKGVTALQNLKNKSNRTGFRYYLNFYRGKADLRQLKQLIHIINSLNIELLLERQILSNEDEINKFKKATGEFQSQIDQEYQKLLNELNSINDFTFARGFVSKSVLEYNMILESYSVTSRKTIKKVITKYITVFEEIIIIIKRKKLKNVHTIEDLFSCDSSETSNRDEIVSKYLLEKTNIDIEKLCKTLTEEHTMETNEIANREITELNTVAHSEVSKISKTVQTIIANMSSEIHNLSKLRETVTQRSEYEVTSEQLKCISNIINTINSLQIKSNKDEIQGLSIYFERVQEKIQIAIQNFETETTECNEVQQFKTKVQTLKRTIYESLTKASFEINEKISRVIFEYNEKLYDLKKNTALSQSNNLYSEENTFSLNDNTRKYITGCYTSEEIFKSIDDILNVETTTDVAQLKTDVSTQLDSTNQIIESELSAIHSDLNQFVQKFSEGMLVVRSIEAASQKQTGQSEVIDQTQIDKLREVNDMVKVISKYVNINAESSEIELKVKIDSTRLRISQLCEQVSQTLTSISDETQIETTINESISSCETFYTELKNSSMVEVNRNINEFLESYQSTMTLLQSHESNDQLTILQNQAYETTADTKYEKFYQLMCRQDYQSSTTVTEAFNYLRRYNLVDSTTIKQKSTEVFRSLSYKMNIEIDNIKYVSEYMLESLQEANKALIKLENSAKQNTIITLNENELNELRKVKSISESWNYNLYDNTMSSIASSVNSAKREIDIEYKRLKTKIESSTDESVIETEINNSLQNIQNICKNTQTSINEKVNLSASNFHTSMSNNITEFQSSGSETLYKSMQTLLYGKSIDTTSKKEDVTQNVDFNSFTQTTDVREIFDEIKTKITNESSSSSTKVITSMEELRKVMYENMDKIENTSTYVVENIQKGFTVISEIRTMLSQKTDYQLTQYQEQQLKKCVSIYQKVENLNVSARSAQERISSNISLVKTEIGNEHTKVNDLVYSLSEERAIEEAIKNSLNKFEQLYAQAKETVKEQLSLVSSNYYSSFMKTLTSIKQQNSNEVMTVLSNIKSGKSSYQSTSEQSFTDTISYFNSNSFKSCLTVKSWYSDIHSSTSVENYSSLNECSTTELSILNEQVNSSLEKMESSSIYVLQAIEKSTEVLKEIEHSVKQDVTYQVTEEQMIELQKCMSVYKSIQTVTSTSSSTSMAQEVIESSISNVKSQISDIYADVTQSIASATTDRSVEEIATKGIKSFEQLYGQAKETVKEELSQAFTSFHSSITQIKSDSLLQTKNEVSTILQEIESGSYLSEFQSDQSFQETVSYFTSSSFKSCISVKNWFNEIRSSTTTSSSTINDKTINDVRQVNEQINNSFEKMESSSTYILNSMMKCTEIFKRIETSVVQSSTCQLTQEEITTLKKSMSIYQSIQSTMNTFSSTSIVQQTIESDITNTKAEINSTYERVTQSVSSLTSEDTINETATKGVEKYEKLFSSVKESIIEQLNQSSSSFYNWYSQLSSDLQDQSTIPKLDSNNVQLENDQSFTSILSCFKSSTFKSSTTIHNLYKEIQLSTSKTEWSYLSERVVNEFSTLNERVIQSIDTLKESSTNILNIIKTSSEILKHIEESTVQESQQELSQEQVTYLQKCMAIYQTIQTVTTTSSTTSETRQIITTDIDNVKNQINAEFSKVSQSINSLSDEHSIRQIATEGVNHVNDYYNDTKEKVQSQLNQTFSNFLSSFENVSSKCVSQNSEISNTLKKISSEQNMQPLENDHSYSSVLSYLKSDAFTSSSAIQSWYNDIQTGDTVNESSSINERTVTELSTLNDRVTKSITSLQENSAYILDSVEKSTQILKQIEQSSTQNSSYQLGQSQIIELQKCMSIYTIIQSTVVTSNSSTTISQVKKTIKADISNVRSEINEEFTKVSQSVSSLSDTSDIEQITSNSVNNIDQYYTQMKEKVQTQLTETSSSFYDSFQNVVCTVEKQDDHGITSVFQKLVNDTDYQTNNYDQSFTNTLQYLKSDSYTSSSVIQNWYSDIQSSDTCSESSNVSENTIRKMNMLNERVTKSVDSMDESSTNILDTMEKGSNILKQVENSISKNSSYQLSEEEISYLQKCLTIYHTVQSSTTITESSLSNSKQVISTDVTNAKSQITEEFSKVSQTLSSLKDEESIKKVVNENVNKVNDYYGEAKGKVQSQITEKTSSFFNSYQQLSQEVEKQGSEKTGSVLQHIISGENSYYKSESDHIFTNVTSYLKNDSFKSTEVIKNWYEEIHSDTSSKRSSTLNENAISELSTLNDRVIKSIDSMEINSLYILDIVEKGSVVLKQVEESVKKDSNYQLTEDQIADLQKSITIYQSVESIAKTKTSTEVSNEIQKISTFNNDSLDNAEQVINNEVGGIKSQINDEYTKSVESIRALSDENSIKQAFDENVSKVDNYYNSAKEKVQSKLGETSSAFFDTLQQTSTSDIQSKSEINSVLQDITNGKSTHQIENDQTFTNVVSYLSSESFKSNTLVQNTFKDIQSGSSTSEFTNMNEHAVSELSTLNNRVTKSVDTMVENSNYIINTFKRGSEIIEQVNENSSSQRSSLQLTQDQIYELQKCVTIYQTIKSITSTSNFTSTTQTNITGDEGGASNQNNSISTDVNDTNHAGRSIGETSPIHDSNDSSDKSASAVNRNETKGQETGLSSLSSSEDQKCQDVKEVITPLKVEEIQQKTTTDVCGIKNQIKDEYTKISQSITSLKDEKSVEKAVNENVKTIDHYYSQAKEEVQSHLTQTSSTFYHSCEHISKSFDKQKQGEANCILRDIVSGTNTYSANDETFTNVISYLQNDSFKSSSVQDMYQEIHSNTTNSDSTNFGEHAITELGTLNERVTQSVDTMEERSKYVFDTIKKGSEILKQVEESSQKNSELRLTEDQIIVLQKCITIYQTIQTTTTTSTSTTSTVLVSSDSVTNQSTTSDEEYEYITNVTRNTKQIVEVEETSQEETNVSVVKNQTTSELDVENVSTSNSVIENSSNDVNPVSPTPLDISKVETESNLDTSEVCTEKKNDDVSLSSNSLDTKSVENNTSSSQVQMGNEAIINKKETDILAEFDVNSNNSKTASKESNQTSMKRTTHSSKLDLLKKFSQHENNQSKVSLNELMVSWKITKSTSKEWPNTCESLTWDSEKYFANEEDKITIKEIAELLGVGRTVIEDSITLKKEKLPLYRDTDEIEMMVVSCIEVVDEILLQLSEVVGEDVEKLRSQFSNDLNGILNSESTDRSICDSINHQGPTLDEQFLKTAQVFFSMKGSKKTDLLNQINKEFRNVQSHDENEARQIATQKFDTLQTIMKSILDNIDCLSLRVVDTVMNAKNSLCKLKAIKNMQDDPTFVKYYSDVKNGQVFCDVVKIPSA